jgi:hypothetical protein
MYAGRIKHIGASRRLRTRDLTLLTIGNKQYYSLSYIHDDTSEATRQCVCFRVSSCCIQDGEASNLADDKLLCLSETNTTPIQGETKYAHMLFIARYLRKNKSNVLYNVCHETLSFDYQLRHTITGGAHMFTDSRLKRAVLWMATTSKRCG